MTKRVFVPEVLSKLIVGRSKLGPALICTIGSSGDFATAGVGASSL